MKKNIIFLVDLDHTLYNVEQEKLYEDAIDLIIFLKKHGKPILFTEGEIEFQKNKIKKLDLERYFNNNIKIFPSYSKLTQLKDNFIKNQVILIDDNPSVLTEAKIKGWNTIRVIRGKYKNININSDFVVSDLKSIENLSIFNNV